MLVLHIQPSCLYSTLMFPRLLIFLLPLRITLICGMTHCQISPCNWLHPTSLPFPRTFTLSPLLLFIVRYFWSHLEKIYLSSCSIFNYTDFCMLKVIKVVCFQLFFKSLRLHISKLEHPLCFNNKLKMRQLSWEGKELFTFSNAKSISWWKHCFRDLWEVWYAV